jgi:hypothetical protein
VEAKNALTSSALQRLHGSSTPARVGGGEATMSVAFSAPSPAHTGGS